ncbi:MAG: hypothetical protein KF760_32490 [Candidatus Eremiobacteraeota bacterium]|nr:hypothetical protein [Candidatus Eremiobacteraeota bacterium]
MLTARLEYQFGPAAPLSYLRTMQMESDPPPLQGLVITTQEWTLLEERDGLMIVGVREEVRERSGPLTQAFQNPPAQRKVYLDGCGLMPKGNEEWAALSPFPMLSEDSLEEKAEWTCSEGVPNRSEPLDITYLVEEFREEGDELVARLSSQGADEQLEVQGRYAFSVSRGVLLHGQLKVVNRLPEGQTVSLLVDLKLV